MPIKLLLLLLSSSIRFLNLAVPLRVNQSALEAQDAAQVNETFLSLSMVSVAKVPTLEEMLTRLSLTSTEPIGRQRK